MFRIFTPYVNYVVITSDLIYYSKNDRQSHYKIKKNKKIIYFYSNVISLMLDIRDMILVLI